jgi:hypothetical protein
MALPAGTVYMEYRNSGFGELSIKCNNNREWSEDSAGDFNVDSLLNIKNTGTGDLFDILDVMEKSPISVPMDFEYTGREGLYDNDQKYAVMDPYDVVAFVDRIRRDFKTMSEGFAKVFPYVPFSDDIKRALMTFPVYDDDGNRLLPAQLNPIWEYFLTSKRRFSLRYIKTDGVEVKESKLYRLDEALLQLLDMYDKQEIGQGVTFQVE